MVKKILKVTMVLLVLLLAFIPLSVNAETYGEYLSYAVNNDNTISITDCDTSVVEIIIPAEIDGLQVTNIASSAFQNCTSLKKIVFEGELPTISYAAFDDRIKLTSIDVPNLETWLSQQARKLYASDLLSNGWNLYVKGSLVENLIIPESVQHIYKNAFYNCNSIKCVAFHDSFYQISEKVFANCVNLSKIEMPDSMQTIGKNAFYNTAFYNNPNNWINGFLYCDKWLLCAKDSVSGEYIIPPRVYCIASNAFENTSITKVTIPATMNSWDNFMQGAFSGATNLECVEFLEGITAIDAGMFSDCIKLSKIILPDTIEQIGDGAFDNTAYYNNENNWDNGSLYIGNALVENRYNGNDTYSVKDGTILIAGASFMDTLYKKIVLPETIKHIDNSAFTRCSNLEQINLPIGIKSISSGAFNGCKKLESVVIPEGVSFVSYNLFKDCSALEIVYIPRSVKQIYNSKNSTIFGGCTNLKEIYFSGTRNEWNKLSNSAYWGIDINTVTVHCIDDNPTIQTTMSSDENTFTVTPTNVPNGSTIIFVCYNDNKMAYVEPFIYAGESTIPFTTTEKYDKVKVMVWENLKTCMPLCEAENVPLN